jgi:ferredoxin-thioredoxin reductase catalytic chain
MKDDEVGRIISIQSEYSKDEWVGHMETKALTDIERALKDKIDEYANKKGYVVNEKNLENIIAGLIENKQEFGDYYCPCRIVRDNEHYKKAIVCPCLYAPREIERSGHCKCLLFYSKKEE